jgi:phosphotriesterase-related protein
VVLSHVDENLSPTYHQALAERGVFLEFDTFGSECCFAEDQLREPRDSERLAAFLQLAEQGYLNQLLISQDVCTKMQWHDNGGRGYAHILEAIVPKLRAAGLTARDLRQVLVTNPAWVLSGEDVSP